MEAPHISRPLGIRSQYHPGYATEYSDIYEWDEFYKSQEINKDVLCQPRCATGPSIMNTDCGLSEHYARLPVCVDQSDLRARPLPRNIGQFKSDLYPCVFREMKIQKDDRGRYIDPYRDVSTLRNGRRLIYDSTHPDMMYASQWSSELTDPPGPYSFPTTTGLAPEVPWCKDLQWQVESEVGKWPTDMWTCWTSRAAGPPYSGHSDQDVYSKYKVQNKLP